MNVGPVLARAGLRATLLHPWQLGLSLLGIALGVAVVVSIDLTTTSANRAFEQSNEVVLGRTTHQVISANGIPESLFPGIQQAVRPGHAAPVVEAAVGINGIEGRAFSLLGLDPLAERELRGYLHSADGETLDIGALMTMPATAVLARQVVDLAGLERGEWFEVSVGGRRHALRLIGILESSEPLEVQATAHLILTDIATAQELLGRYGTLSHIDLRVDGADEAAVLRRLREVLPTSIRLVEVGSRTRESLAMARAFRLNLLMLSLLALLVGMFLIFNTVSFSVVQRHAIFGHLRTLGVTRGQLLRLILAEATGLGLVGSLLGLGLGVLLAGELLGLVTQTLSDHYFSVAVTSILVTPQTLLKGLALGVAASIIAAALPALEAMSIAPVMVAMRSRQEARARAWTPWLAAVGLVSMLGAFMLLGVTRTALAPGFLSLSLLVVGATLMSPALLLGMLRVSDMLLRSFGSVLGPMAVRGIVGSFSRTSVAVAALMVSLATTVGVSIMVESFRSSLATWLDATLQADVYVTVPGVGGGRIDPAIMARLRDLSGIEEHSEGVTIEVDSGMGRVHVAGIAMAARSHDGFVFTGGVQDEVWDEFHQQGKVLVTEPLAWRHDFVRGDRLKLETDEGERAFEIGAVVRDYGSQRGAIIMSRERFDRHWPDRGVSTVGLYLQEDASAETLIGSVERAAAGTQSVYARANEIIREHTLAVFDRTFVITKVLRWLAVGIAFVGIVCALLSIQLEKFRETAVLRALGVARAQVGRLVLLTTGLMGCAAGLLAAPLGVAMAWMLTAVINRRSFGWSIDLTLGAAPLLLMLALAIVAALLAGLYPAWRMTRTHPGLALRDGEHGLL